jgi:hypothetical protein
MLHHSRLLLMVACIVFMLGRSKATHAEDIDVAREQFKTGQYKKCLELTRKAIEDSTYRSRRYIKNVLS